MKFIERFLRKVSVRPVASGEGQPPLLIALEPRIMFDASVGVVAQEAAQATAEPAKDSTSTDQASAPAASADTRPSQSDQRHEVVFVDGQVANIAELLQGLSGNREVVILDSTKDGLQQMADYLKGREGLDAIQLLSHGADGSVQMGNVWLTSNNLGEHREALQSIGAALKADGDLMLYGCKVGETATGQAFLNQLATITGADVAASADDTGATTLGGDWTLERTVGAIETASLGAQLHGYTAVMAASFTGGADANAPVLGLGGLPKMIIGDFNNDGRADIMFQTSSSAGSPWKFAAGNVGGGFTIVDQSNAASPFRNVVMIDAANTGTNYYAADFDGDGDTDVLGVTVTLGPAYLYRNTNGVFTREATTGFGGTQFGSRLVVGDFNGDGAADILYQPGSVDPANAWRYALNNGNGTFNDMPQSASPFAAFNLAIYNNFNYRVIDYDGDGDLDIIYMLAAGPAALYINNGSGAFSAGAAGNIPITTFSQRSIWGDFDGDGDADMFWQIGANGTEWNYAENLGNGNFNVVSRASSPFAGLSMIDFGTTNFRTGDFDGDGDTDLIGTASGVGASVYYQAGTAPQLVSSTPGDDSSSVSPSANIVLTFDQNVDKGSGNIYIVRTSDNQVIQTIDVTSSAVNGSGTTWTIDPPADLVQGVAYAVRVDSKTFVNAAGKVYLGIQTNTALNFVTSSIAAPVISGLNGDSVTYIEGTPALPIDLNGNAVVTDADSTNFSGGTLTVAIGSGGISSEDVLGIISVGSAATQISVSGNVVSYGGTAIGTFAGGTLGNPLVVTFNSNATPVAVTALLHQLSYSNSNTGDIGSANRNVHVTLTDGTGGTSAVANVNVVIAPVNDAPIVTTTPSAPTFTEGGSAVGVFSNTSISTVEAGQKVIQFDLRVTGLANGSSERLRIDGTDVFLINGNSVTTSTNGLSISVVVAGNSATVTVSSSAGLASAMAGSIVDGIRYANDSKAQIGSSRTVVLSSVRDNGGLANGGSNATDVGASSVVSLVAVNDAPTLSGGPFVLPGTTEDSTSSVTSINTLLAGLSYSDLDASALLGAAVTATSGTGTWQFSLNGVTGWTNFGTVSNSNALLLTGNSFVRYIPGGASGETATLTLRAWDQTSGTASSAGVKRTADTSISGGSTAFSSGTAMASMSVTDVNDAPVLSVVSPTLPGLADTAVNNSGVLVSSLYAGNYIDVDTGALKGIAITSLNSGNGSWQYSLDGTTWNNVGVVSASTALLLRASDHVRFVPNGANASTADFTFRAWDQTGATAGMQGTKVDTSVAGATTAFSSGLDTASVTVTAVNDAPILTGTGGNVAWTEGNNTASIPVIVDSGLTITDTDGPGIASATVRISGNYSSGQDYLALVSNPATMGNIQGAWDAANGILTLTSAGNQATLAQFQAALRAVTFTNLSDTPATSTRTVQFQVNDGSLDSSAISRSITLTAVDDAPLISAPTSTMVVEDIASVINQISISDPDSTSGTVTLNVGSGSLAAFSGAGVTVSGTSSAMTLSGTIAAINTFIASNRLTYTAAANATADVTLSISVDTASSASTSTTVTLNVVPVNDAPVASVPSSITVQEDVSSSLTGISFSDVDAGSASVTATFSVPGGTLSAISGGGVTVQDSGTATLTLSGTLANINAFIAAAGVKFQTARDNTNSVLLTVSINDNGNTGGVAQSDTKTVIINVTAVNDAPVNSVPTDQRTSQNVVLAFNTANGNAISLNDVDAGSSLMIVTLSSLNGTLSLSDTSGVTLIIGSGIDNTVIRLQGTQANLNTVLQSLTFKPTNGYIGTAQLTIQSNDQGNTGSGGAKSDFDTITISVIPVNPKVTGVFAQGLDRTVKVGDEVLINMVFDQSVNADLTGGIPSLLLETGLLDRNAVYVSGAGSNTLVFKYIVQAGDVSADLDFQSAAALQLNGATLANITGDLAVLTLPSVGGADSLGGRSNIVVDGLAPVVASVTAPSDGTYIIGQNLDFTVNFSENVVVDSTGGVPRIAVTLNTGGTVYADYVSGSGGSALVFRLTVATGQLDSNGITLGSAVQLNGGSIRDGAGNNTAVTLNSVGSTAHINVDGVVPAVVSVATPGDGSYKAGDVLTFTVNASEALQTGALAPRLVLNVGGVTRYASYVSGAGSNALVFQYVVQAGDNDGDGIAVNTIDLRGEQLTDLAGNNLNLMLNGIGSTAGVLVDTRAPSASGIVRIDASPTHSGSVSFTVTFDEAVSGVDTSDFVLALGGTASGTITSATRVDGHTWTVVVDNLSGVGSLGLNLKGSGTGIVDAANNAITGGLAGATYSVDRLAPSVTHVDVPAAGSYVAGQNLDFTVHLDEAVQLNTSNGSPRLEVTLDNGVTAYATYLSGAGSNALVFRLTVASGQLDTNGISVGNSIQLNGATLRDAVGNNANTTLNGLGSTTGVLIDAVVPVIDSVGLPADGSYKAGDVLTFTVNASEALQTGALAPRLVLDVGGVTRYASYVSGAGSNALVFQYVVQAGDNDGDGIAVNTIDLRGEQLTDLAGNNLNLTLNGVGSTAGVLVDTRAPSASGIVRIDASPTHSGSVSFTVTFDEAVSGVDTSDFVLALGGTASGTITSATRVDGHTWTVVVDNLSGVGSLGLNLKGSSTGIVDAANNAITGGLAGATYSVDRVAPSVTHVDVPAAGSYVAGQNLDFTVHLDEAVQLNTSNGSPRLEVTLDNGVTAYATYLSGAGSNALVFRLTVASGQLDTNGISVGNSIQLNGATLRDAVGNNANTTLNGLGSTTGVLVDAVVPVIDSVGLPADGSYKAGDVLTFTVNASEGVVVDTSSGTPRLVLSVGGVTRYASYVSGAAGGALVFQYRVQPGDTAAGGLVVGSTLDLNGGTVRDQAGNALKLNLNGLGSAGNVLIDTTQPTASNLFRVDASPTNNGSVSYTLTFSENVNGVDASDFNLFFTGTASGSIASVTRVDGRTYTVLIDAVGGAGTLRLDLNASGTGIVDAAGNAVVGGLTGASYSIDRVAPRVVGVDVPANGTYVAGQNLDFTVNLSEAVQVDSTNGTPRIKVTLDNGATAYATYLSGAGTNALVFRLSVTSGMSGNTTFNVGSVIDLDGGGIRDAQGNDVQAGLNNVADTRGILLDARHPQPSSIVVDGPVQPTDRTLNFTLTFDEAVSGVDAGDFSLVGTGNASGLVQSVQQIDAKTYRITVGSINGAGALALSLNAFGSGIRDQAGNGLTQSLVGQSQAIQSQDVGDLHYRLNPPETLNTPQAVLVQPQVPGIVTNEAVSPLAAPGLFEVRTVGGDLLPLGTIFLGDGSSAPSFIAQVFASSNTGLGGLSGFLGFGGGDGGVFASSTFAGIFNRDVPGISEMNVFNGSQWKQSDLNQGLRGVFGAPTFGQQLHQINEVEQRQVRELAMALAQSAQIGKRA